MSGCTIELDVDPGIARASFRYLPETSRPGVGEWHTVKVSRPYGIDNWYRLLAGEYGLTELHELDEGKLWCVVIGGSAYVLFCKNPEISDALPFGPVIGSFKDEQRNIIFLNSFTNVCALTSMGVLWTSERLFTDDLVIMGVTADALKVKGWNAADDKQMSRYIDLKTGLEQR